MDMGLGSMTYPEATGMLLNISKASLVVAGCDAEGCAMNPLLVILKRRVGYYGACVTINCFRFFGCFFCPDKPRLRWLV